MLARKALRCLACKEVASKLRRRSCRSNPWRMVSCVRQRQSRVLIFFHGGGYCSGSIVSHRRMVTEAGRAARMRTLAIGYRLAPEYPFPAAHEDAMTAWGFLRKKGFATDRIA